MIRIGKLRHRVTLQAPTETANAYGEQVQSWTDVAEVWASVTPLSGKERFYSQQVRPQVTHSITIRYREGVDTTYRIAYGNRIFHIDSVLNEEELNRKLMLMVRQG